MDIDALLRWRIGTPEARALERLARLLLETFRCDAGEGEPAHRTLGIRDSYAAVLLLVLWERAAREFGEVPEPDEITTLRAIAETARK